MDVQQTSKVHGFPSYATEGTRWEVCNPLCGDSRQQNVEAGKELEEDYKMRALQKHWAKVASGRIEEYVGEIKISTGKEWVVGRASPQDQRVDGGG